MAKNVLLVGSGGREHAIAWSISHSSDLGKLWIAPGNAGTGDIGENVPDVGADDLDGIVALAERTQTDLVIVGPEDSLAAGLTDRLLDEGIPVFGPTAAAAQIEASKGFAKKLMAESGIDTAAAEVFTDLDEALAYVRGLAHPPVIKADGLAVGKGVVVCDDLAQAESALTAAMSDRVFGESGSKVLIEERMYGREVSAHAFSDGVTVRHMPFSCDHKPVFDGDHGPNTGGMGVYSPPGWLDNGTAAAIRGDVTQRIIRALADDGRPYRGVIYPGMMVTADGPRVVEFNARFGDPETEVLLPKLRSDLLAICDAVAHGKLSDAECDWDDSATVGVMMASGGYPGSYERGIRIHGVEDVDSDVQVFMAGAQRDDEGRLMTAGGRVLCVVARGDTMSEAREQAYDNVARITFAGAHFRTDIGATADQPLEFPTGASV
jgi:phosphoribosylamine--glycine ligase